MSRHQHGHSANAGSWTRPAVMPHARGMQPPPQDAKQLYRHLTALSWAIHCLHGSRAKVALVADRYDQRLARMRREHDAYSSALEALDPALFARAEARRRDYDDPIAAFAWAQKGSTDDVL